MTTPAPSDIAVAPELVTALAAHGLSLHCEEGVERPLVLQGATFRHKDRIREAGGAWSRTGQCWRLHSTAELERLGALLAGDGGLRETADRFEPADPRGGVPARAPEAGRRAAYGSKHYHGHRERLRTRFLESGADALADYELLEMILFFSVWRRDTKPLAKAMLERFGSLGGVLAAEPSRYAELVAGSTRIAPDDGAGSDDIAARSEAEVRRDEDLRFTQVLLKAIKACLERTLKEEIKARPVISSWTALIDYLTQVMSHEPAEHFRLLFLDRKNILIKDEVQSRGTVDHTPLYPREVVKRALELAASAVIMVHNHPSGDPTPSQADVTMTRQVVDALQPVGITVHDHVIIGKNRHTSFRSQGLI
ncbi:MAG: JAB domain-containing protein [Geminicoccaceae bacterium]|nr:JAB domain-containing protein [Geminicoccaceae bacterium]